MNFVIVLHFLAGVVLTAPQQQRVGGDIKPFKKVTTDFTHCLITDDGPFHPPTPIPSEECTGTMTYCFRRLYKMPQNRENYTSIDECLRSRNINPDDLDGQPILNEYDYRDGVLALDRAYLDYRDNTGLSAIVSEKTRQAALLSANKGLDTALEKLKTALSPELFEKINANIRDTKEKLGVPGVNIEAVVDNFKKLRDWIRDTTTEKYMVLLEYGWDTIPYN